MSLGPRRGCLSKASLGLEASGVGGAEAAGGPPITDSTGVQEIPQASASLAESRAGPWWRREDLPRERPAHDGKGVQTGYLAGQKPGCPAAKNLKRAEATLNSANPIVTFFPLFAGRHTQHLRSWLRLHWALAKGSCQ